MARAAGCVPRILADDLLLIYVGPMLARFVEVFCNTHEFLIDMGARVAPNKSYLFSTCPMFRKWLSGHTWPLLDKTIDVSQHFRDLGTHINTAARFVGSTLTDRMNKAVASVNRMRWLPHDFNQKAMFVLSAALSAGLYGCEAAWANETALASLTSAIANVVSHVAPLRSNAIMFSLFKDKQEVDPSVVILMRRLVLFRRMCIKKPQFVQMATDIFYFLCRGQIYWHHARF